MATEVPVYEKRGNRLVLLGVVTPTKRASRLRPRALRMTMDQIVDFGMELVLPPRLLAVLSENTNSLRDRLRKTRREERWWYEHDCSWKRQVRCDAQYLRH